MAEGGSRYREQANRPELLSPRESRLALGLLIALIIAVTGLLSAFLLSIRWADQQFERAALAERQATAVALISADVEAAASSAKLAAALSHYGSLIHRETRLLGTGLRAQARQRDEMADFQRLQRLAFDPIRRMDLRLLVTRIGSKEAAEVAETQVALARLRTRSIVLSVLLGAAAILCAVASGWILFRRNRDLERQVRQRAATLEEIDRSRRLFFAKASHELRTPVTAMRGEAEVALADATAQAPRLRQSLSHVLANATFLGHRIEELLGLAGAEDGKLHLLSEPVDLGAVVRDAVSDAAAFAASVEVEMEVVRPEGYVAIQGDARWLRQALLAVIDNALKFSPQGGRLAVCLAAEGDRARITVTDQGPGMVAQDLPRIFDAYYQSEAGRMRGGTGLGLALARWVVERHGGSIRAENMPGRGCRFVLSLPLERAV